MTSFAVAVEPRAAPRLAAAAALVHLAAAVSPWIARMPLLSATAASLAAAASLALTMACLPGRHCSLVKLRIDSRGCRVRLAGLRRWRQAPLGPRSRAYASIVFLDLRTAGRRHGWLLPRGVMPPAEFRRLKARIRLTC
jgi:hypothetical protein